MHKKASRVQKRHNDKPKTWLLKSDEIIVKGKIVGETSSVNLIEKLKHLEFKII